MSCLRRVGVIFICGFFFGRFEVAGAGFWRGSIVVIYGVGGRGGVVSGFVVAYYVFVVIVVFVVVE